MMNRKVFFKKFESFLQSVYILPSEFFGINCCKAQFSSYFGVKEYIKCIGSELLINRYLEISCEDNIAKLFK